MPTPLTNAWLIVTALEFAALILLMLQFGRKLNTMAVDQKTFDDKLGVFAQATTTLAQGAEKLVAAVKAHPAAADFTAEMQIVTDGLQGLATAQADVDAALNPPPAETTPATPATPVVVPDPNPPSG